MGRTDSIRTANSLIFDDVGQDFKAEDRGSRIHVAPARRPRKVCVERVERDALIASGTEIVTVALRRADLSRKAIHTRTFSISSIRNVSCFLPNTSGAVMRPKRCVWPTAANAASADVGEVEIHPDPRYLLPDPVETMAPSDFGKEGFTVLPTSTPIRVANVAGCRHGHGHAARLADRQ